MVAEKIIFLKNGWKRFIPEGQFGRGKSAKNCSSFLSQEVTQKGKEELCHCVQVETANGRKKTNISPENGGGGLGEWFLKNSAWFLNSINKVPSAWPVCGVDPSEYF